MNKEKAVEALKDLLNALSQGRMTRQEVVEELYKRIDPGEVYNLLPDEPQGDIISEAFVSLEHLTDEGFATSNAEILYLAECYEGKRKFSREEIRKFPIGNFENESRQGKFRKSSRRSL